MTKQILLIEDDEALSNGVCLALKSPELAVRQCFDLNSARSIYQKEHFDLLILDINLPDGNGLYFLKEVKKTQGTPIILLTANDLETDIVAGLEMGADDYITKPFSLAILRAHVNARLRQMEITRENGVHIDDFYFNFNQMTYYKKKIPIELSKTEQKLLKLLVCNRPNVLSRADLVDRIWSDGAEYVDENALSVTIKRLRDKLEDNPSKPNYIKTIYGIGYAWMMEMK